MTENELASLAVDICLKIHKQYGPGLYEKVYEEIFCYELKKLNVNFQRQVNIPLIHENLKIPAAYKADLILEDKLIIEIKSCRQLFEMHFRQLHTYLKIKNFKLGLVINFNVSLIKYGIRRIVNGL
jgi:GxxExxY protein